MALDRGSSSQSANEPSVQAVVVNFRDITERKKAENALLQIEETTLSLWTAKDSTQLQALLLNQLVKMYRIEHAATFLLRDQKIVLGNVVGEQILEELELGITKKLQELLLTKKPQLFRLA